MHKISAYSELFLSCAFFPFLCDYEPSSMTFKKNVHTSWKWPVLCAMADEIVSADEMMQILVTRNCWMHNILWVSSDNNIRVSLY